MGNGFRIMFSLELNTEGYLVARLVHLVVNGKLGLEQHQRIDLPLQTS